MEKLTTEQHVNQFVHACECKGFKISRVTDSIVTIQKDFTPENREEFFDADIAAFAIMGYAPLKGGSVWGTDGGSVGGFIALKSGNYTLNKSGSGSRFTNALKKKLNLK